jgi:hypothetical protein
MKDIFPSLPTATELPCAASALVTNASGPFAELKSRRYEGYCSLIPTGHKFSVRPLLYKPVLRALARN